MVRRDRVTNAVALGAASGALVLFVDRRPFLGAVSVGFVGLWVLVRHRKPRDLLDLGGERQSILDTDPFVNFVPPDTHPVPLASTPEWAWILSGGDGTHAWVRRRMAVDGDVTEALAHFKTEASRQGWELDQGASPSLRFRRTAGQSTDGRQITDVVEVTRTGDLISLVATVVEAI